MPRAGFTLLELLLVLVLIGILSGVAASRLNGLRTSTAVDQAARQVADQVRRAQGLALQQRQPVRLRLDLDQRTTEVQVLMAGGPRDPADGASPVVHLAASADRFTLDYARGDQLRTGSPVDVVFLPDRRCDGAGTMTIAIADRAMTVRIDGGARPPVVALGEVRP